MLITGGSGYIGSIACEYFEKCGFLTKNIDIGSSNLKNRIDIRDYETMEKIFKSFKPTIVLHLAALASVPLCQKNIKEAFDINVIGTSNTALLSNLTNSRLIFASSAAVYGSPMTIPTPVSTVTNPTNIYGLTKLLGEEIIKHISKNYAIFRIFNVYGGNCNRSYVIPDIIRKIKRNKKQIKLLGTGKERKDFVFINDVLEVFNIATKKNINGVFNLGSGKPIDIDHLSRLIKRLMGTTRTKVTFEGVKREGDIEHSHADINGINKFPGWQPNTKILEGLTYTIKSMNK